MDATDRAYRMAIAATAGLSIELLRGSLLPPLAPILAIQLLVGAGQPQSARQAIGFVVVVALASFAAFAVASVAIRYSGLYTLTMAVAYLWIFALCFRARTAAAGALLLTVVVVVTSIVPASTLTAGVVVAELSIATATALLVGYLAFAIIPPRMAAPAAPVRVEAETAKPAATVFRRSLLAVLVLLPLQLFLTHDGVAPIVALLVIATMLRLADSTSAGRYGWTFAVGNLAGASLASLNVTLMSLQDQPAVLLTTVATAALLMSGGIFRGATWMAVLLPGLIAYFAMFGITLSPLPIADDVAAVDRFLTILAATAYALAALALLGPWIAPRETATPLRA